MDLLLLKKDSIFSMDLYNISMPVGSMRRGVVVVSTFSFFTTVILATGFLTSPLDVVKKILLVVGFTQASINTIELK